MLHLYFSFLRLKGMLGSSEKHDELIQKEKSSLSFECKFTEIYSTHINNFY